MLSRSLDFPARTSSASTFLLSCQISLPGPNLSPTDPGPFQPDNETLQPNGGVTGPTGVIGGPNGEIFTPTPPTTGGLEPSSDGSPLPTGGSGVVVGPNGELPGTSMPSTGSGGSPTSGGDGPPDPGPALAWPTSDHGNPILLYGNDRISGPIASVRSLKDVISGVSDTNFNRNFEAPGFHAGAATRTPGDVRPTPIGQHTVLQENFNGEASNDWLRITADDGGADVRNETRFVSGSQVSGLRLRTESSSAGGQSHAEVRLAQAVATPKNGETKVVQWTIGDVRANEGPSSSARSSAFTTQIRLGVGSTVGDSEGVCASEHALIAVDLSFSSDTPDTALFTLLGQAPGSDTLVIPFAGYVDFADFDGQLGNATIALHLSASRVDVTLNGDPLLNRGLRFDELGLTGIEDLGETLEIFAFLANAEGTTSSFSLDDLLVFQNTPIPEPHAWMLLLMGTVLLAFRRQRHSR
ncbi:MAG: hypothetical protein ACI957_001742 [Verrucomicrobiales bacterium]